MAVQTRVVRPSPEGKYGPIEALTLEVLTEELDKLYGTLADDHLMDYSKCQSICDEFIDELGQCLNLSMVQYPGDKEIYNHMFDGLQVCIDLLHGNKEGLLGSDSKPRMMDPQEARQAASDHLMDGIDWLKQQIAMRQNQPPPEAPMTPPEPPETGEDETRQPRRRPR